jgi:hypothetical protein
MRALVAGVALGMALALFLGLAGTAAARESVRPNADAGPTEVKTVVFLVNINAVREAENSYEANVYYRLRWHDPRLAGPAALRPPASEIWTPVVGISNQQLANTIIPPTIDIAEDGTVTMRQQHWSVLSQSMDLRRFPFDTQTFHVTLLSPDGPDEIALVPDPLAPSGIAQSVSVPDWVVTGTAVQAGPVALSEHIPPTAAFTLSVTADRKAFYYIYAMILPLIVIAGMSMVAFWIEPEDYVSRLGIASTSMLTIVTYRVAAAQILPRSAYFTNLDVFIAGATVLVFLALAAIVLEMMMVRRGNPGRAQRVDIGARVVLPLSFVVLGFVAFA